MAAAQRYGGGSGSAPSVPSCGYSPAAVAQRRGGGAAASAASGPPPLPPGWVEAKDPRYDNTPYWYHKETKETSWTRPTGPQGGGYLRHPQGSGAGYTWTGSGGYTGGGGGGGGGRGGGY